MNHLLFSRLLGAASLASLLMAGIAEAGPVTCVDNTDTFFPTAAYRCETVDRVYTPSAPGATFSFDFGTFTNTLDFDAVLHDMVVTMSAFFVHPGNADFLSRVPAGYSPATFDTTDGATWIYFRVEDLQDSTLISPPQVGTDAPPQNGTDFTGSWTQTIRWFGLDSITGRIFDVLHDRRPLGAGENGFVDVITVPGSFDPFGDPCGGDCCPPTACGDPGISGSADDFSDTLVVSRAVPEPASGLLVLAGLAAALRKHRSRQAGSRV